MFGENNKKLKILKLSRDVRYLQKLALKKNTKRYVEGIARNVDVYIDPWRVQSDSLGSEFKRYSKKKKSKIADMLLNSSNGDN